MNENNKGCAIAVVTVLVIIALSFLWAAIAYWLWAPIMVGVFGLPALTYWQTFGLIWLLKMILPGHSSSTSSSNK